MRSPFGNRYTVKRVDVSVEATDGSVSAISGEGLDQGMIVILADRKRNIEKFMDMYPTLCEMFTAYMEVKALSEKKLVAFAKKYAREREYVIGEMGELALHTQISLRQSNDHAVTVMEVKRIVDDAIKHVEKKTATHFFDILLGKRYDIEDMTILGEKDFA